MHVLQTTIARQIKEAIQGEQLNGRIFTQWNTVKVQLHAVGITCITRNKIPKQNSKKQKSCIVMLIIQKHWCKT